MAGFGFSGLGNCVGLASAAQSLSLVVLVNQMTDDAMYSARCITAAVMNALGLGDGVGPSDVLLGDDDGVEYDKEV